MSQREASWAAVLTKYFYGGQILGDEIGRICGMNGANINVYRFSVRETD